MTPWNRRFFLETIIFRFHVKFGEGIYAAAFLKVSERLLWPQQVLSARSGEHTCDLDVKPAANVRGQGQAAYD